MSTSSHSASPAAAPSSQALPPYIPAEPAPDAHDVDAVRSTFVPAPRNPRRDGWTPQRQIDFVAALADAGCVADAAKAVGMSVTSCYRLRRLSAPFAAAWDAAIPHAAQRLVDVAVERALHGAAEPVYDRKGNRVGGRIRHNDRLLMFLLRAYLPARFNAATGPCGRTSDQPIAEALRLLEPDTPAEPRRLPPPDERDSDENDNAFLA